MKAKCIDARQGLVLHASYRVYGVAVLRDVSHLLVGDFESLDHPRYVPSSCFEECEGCLPPGLLAARVTVFEQDGLIVAAEPFCDPDFYWNLADGDASAVQVWLQVKAYWDWWESMPSDLVGAVGVPLRSGPRVTCVSGAGFPVTVGKSYVVYGLRLEGTALEWLVMPYEDVPYPVWVPMSYFAESASEMPSDMVYVLTDGGFLLSSSLFSEPGFMAALEAYDEVACARWEAFRARVDWVAKRPRF